VRYFANIAAIVIISIIAAFTLNNYFSNCQCRQVKNPSLVVGNARYTLEDLQQRIKKSPYAFTDRAYFINSVIDRELLLQEAQRERLDQEPEFVHAMQEFLEQSLVRLVVDRHYNSLKPNVSDADIERYRANCHSRYKLQIYSCRDENTTADNCTAERVVEQRYTVLPFSLRNALAQLPMGQISRPLWQDGHVIRVKILQVTPDGDRQTPTREQVAAKLLKEQKSYMMEQWLHQLRQRTPVISSTALERWKNGQH